MIFWVVLFLLPFVVILAGLGFRPLYIHRGLTLQEWKDQWPGDSIVPGATPSGSRAIHVNAPANEVWRWITQIGQDRAGFYSYRWLENLVGSKMPDVQENRAEWSTRNVGEVLIMAPLEKFGPIATMEIVSVEEGHYYVAKNNEGTWAFIVEPESPTSCRFVARGTWLPSRNLFAQVMHTVFFDPIHYIMEWKMVRKVKALAEQQTHVGLLGCSTKG